MPNQAERLSAIINTTVDGIIVIDGRGLIESLNPAAEGLFGYVESEVVGRNVSLLMPSPFREEHDQYLERYQTTGRAAIIGKGRQVRGKRKDGSIFPLHLSVGEMFIDGERKFTGVLHDLTLRVELEERLRTSEAKWRAIIDSAIDGIIVIDTRGAIEAFNPAAARMFGYPEDEVIGKNVKVLMQRDQSLAGIRINVRGTARPIMVDPEMLKMVIQNLLINAAHAMRSVGTIRVEMTVADDQCTIAISDAGPGIPADVRDKMFTPFFTTKSSGTGLGLPTAKRFIEAHQGQIAVDCPPVGGTTITVRLPVT